MKKQSSRDLKAELRRETHVVMPPRMEGKVKNARTNLIRKPKKVRV